MSLYPLLSRPLNILVSNPKLLKHPKKMVVLLLSIATTFVLQSVSHQLVSRLHNSLNTTDLLDGNQLLRCNRTHQKIHQTVLHIYTASSTLSSTFYQLAELFFEILLLDGICLLSLSARPLWSKSQLMKKSLALSNTERD